MAITLSHEYFGRVVKGGQGSGNFGHEGRPGEVGGSGEGNSDKVSADLIGGKFREGSAMGNLYNALSSGESKSLSAMRQLVSTVGNPDGRIAAMKKIGEQSGQWKLHIDKANDSIRMEHVAVVKPDVAQPSVEVTPTVSNESLIPHYGQPNVSAIYARGVAIDQKLSQHDINSPNKFSNAFRQAAEIPNTVSTTNSFRTAYAGLKGDDHAIDDAKGGVDFVNHMVGDAGIEARLGFRKTSDARSYAQGNNIYLQKYASRATVAHEIGHWVEHNRNDVYTAATAFLKDRQEHSEGIHAQIRPLNDITGKHNHTASEKAFSDNFDMPYTGKIYASGGKVTATEVVSIGLERLYRSPSSFREKNPTHYHFMLGLLDHVAKNVDTKPMRIKASSKNFGV